MGRYEDLVDQAAAGDAAAADALKEEFSGSALRTKAEENAADAQAYKESKTEIMEARFWKVTQDLDEDLRGILSIDDLDIDSPNDITVDLLKSKAEAKVQVKREADLVQAKEFGFETVEEMQETLTKVKEEKAKKVADLEKAGNAASSSSGTPATSEEGSTFDKGKDTYEKARKAGQTTDKALGEAVHSIMADQAPVDIEE